MNTWLWIAATAACLIAIATGITLVGRQSNERRGGLLDLTPSPDSRKNARPLTDDEKARRLGFDPERCARGDHSWYASWGFCANPFCDAVMPGLRRVGGQPVCTECGAVTTTSRHAEGCTVFEAIRRDPRFATGLVAS